MDKQKYNLSYKLEIKHVQTVFQEYPRGRTFCW